MKIKGVGQVRNLEVRTQQERVKNADKSRRMSEGTSITTIYRTDEVIVNFMKSI